MNISVKLFQNLYTCLAEQNGLGNFGGQSPKELKEEKSLKVFFLFLALAAILFNGAERFEQFW